MSSPRGSVFCAVILIASVLGSLAAAGAPPPASPAQSVAPSGLTVSSVRIAATLAGALVAAWTAFEGAPCDPFDPECVQAPTLPYVSVRAPGATTFGAPTPLPTPSG